MTCPRCNGHCTVVDADGPVCLLCGHRPVRDAINVDLVSEGLNRSAPAPRYVCADCGVEVRDYRAQRCQTCGNRHAAKRRTKVRAVV